MALEGSLQIFKLPEILQMITLQQNTGILTVQGESDIVAISFLRGRVVAADALNQTVEERLGRVLAARGLVRLEDFAAVTAEHQTGGGRPIDLLVSGGFVTRPQLLAALRSQTLELLLEVLRWRLGDFKFYSGEEVSYEDGFEPIAVQELIVGALAVDPPAAPPLVQAAGPPAAPSAARSTARPASPPSGQNARDQPPPPRPTHAPVSAPEDGRSQIAAKATAAGAPETSGRSRLSEIAAVAVGSEPRAMSRQSRADIPRGMVALVLFSALAAILVVLPGRLVLPFPGQQEAMANEEKVRRSAHYQKLDGAARTYFLLEGRYPEELQVLVDMELLDRSDLADASRRPLAYTTSGLQYTVEPVDWGEGVAALGAAEAVTGDFLLDAEFLRYSGRTQTAPLVLLD